jgi:hypothetical protein
MLIEQRIEQLQKLIKLLIEKNSIDFDNQRQCRIINANKKLEQLQAAQKYINEHKLK